MGGAQHVVYELIKNINPYNYQITVICYHDRRYSILENKIINEGYNVIFLKSNKYIKIFELYSVLKKIKPDIVHAHQRGILAAIWTLLNSTYIITTIHTSPHEGFSWLPERLFFFISLFFHRNIVVAISEYNKTLIKNFWRLPDKYVYYINDGVEIKNFYKKEHNIFSFINVGRQDENKNQILILKAFLKLHNEYDDIKLYLLGDGENHIALKKFVKNAGLENNVEFTGFLESPRDYLAISDVYISSSNLEGLSLSVLEGMASGLAVIATDAGGVRDLARENGILIQINDEKALFDSMKKLYIDRKLCALLGKKSLEMVKDYSSVDMAEKYCRLYDKYAGIKGTVNEL